MNKAIQLESVNIYQRGNAVLNDVNFCMEAGDFAFLIGQTGSGKSSLLKTIYADLPLTEGTGTVAGYDLKSIKTTDIPFLRRKLGIVFQDFQLLTDRSIRENFYFAMGATGWIDKHLMDTKINELLERVNLLGKIDKMPHELSGGEQQRVVIARALVNDPQIILADEPTGNLDPQSSADIVGLLKQLSSTGTAVLMATHDYKMIEMFPSHIFKCENGKVIDNEVLYNN